MDGSFYRRSYLALKGVPDEVVNRRAEMEVGAAIFQRIINQGDFAIRLESNKESHDLFGMPGKHERHFFEFSLTPIPHREIEIVHCQTPILVDEPSPKPSLWQRVKKFVADEWAATA